MNFKNSPIGQKDMFDKEICEGHIVAVRYVWNSYVGVIRFINSSFVLYLHDGANRFKGTVLHHSINPTGTYQILSHFDPLHPDYNKDVVDWYMSETGYCPIEIKVYANAK